MEPITIYFFALATLLGLEDASIVCQKATVNIDPVEKTFVIQQENLFAMIITPEDSVTVEHELQHILDFHKNHQVSPEDSLIIDQINFNKQGKQLNAVVKGRYTDPEILAKAGIYYDAAKGEFALVNMPDWTMNTAEAVLEENYWLWPADQSVEIVVKSFENIPQEYRAHQRSILPFWERYFNQ